MSFESFKSAVRQFISRAGGDIAVRFSQDEGKHIAYAGDGTRIFGNPVSRRLTVQWASGHQAMVTC